MVDFVLGSGLTDSELMNFVTEDSWESIFSSNLDASFLNSDVNGFSGLFDLFEGPGENVATTAINVTVNDVVVTVNSDDVFVNSYSSVSVDRKMYYIARVDITDEDGYSFSHYRDPTFYDWASLIDGGQDTPGYIITGYFPGNDFQRWKSIEYATFHFNRTADTQDGSGNLVPASSCLVRTAWDWENKNNLGLSTEPFFGNNWSKQFQAYRYRRKTNVNSFDWGQGQDVISSRNKIRGEGKVFSFEIETEPGKDCQLLGWSLVISGAGNV